MIFFQGSPSGDPVATDRGTPKGVLMDDPFRGRPVGGPRSKTVGKDVIGYFNNTSAALTASGVTLSLLSILAISVTRSCVPSSRMCDWVLSPSLSL